MLERGRYPCWVVLRGRDVFEDLFDGPLDGYGALHVHCSSYLKGATFAGAQLQKTWLGAADLANADLASADLTGAYLKDADLTGATLTSANLTNAVLINAVLTNAVGVTSEELVQQAYSLRSATMPNGQKYEDWLKNKGCGEDGENSGP
jgi:uncharacterized protein YjbI with pentapeptide repeats